MGICWRRYQLFWYSVGGVLLEEIPTVLGQCRWDFVGGDTNCFGTVYCW